MPEATSPDLVAESAPAVVAVVVTCDPGWWLEECLGALADQDYPNFSVLVIDADSAEDPTARVASVMPNAYVRRVRRRRGFTTAANEVIGVVEGASHYLFCHDDVAPDPGAVRHLVEEAFRSNAGVVTPKLTGWFHPDLLLAVGMGMDGFGAPVHLVEVGDLDQQQHDAARDVFFAPAPCSLVRADLFASLGGFDGGSGIVGEDMDLSWRAHLAGARVVTAPDARVRHLGATEAGQRGLDGALLAADTSDPLAGAYEPAPLPARVAVDTAGEVADWEDEDTPAGESLSDRQSSWRARWDARRQSNDEEWSGWEEDDWSPRRGRRRRAPLPAQHPPLEGPEAAALRDIEMIARLRAVIANYSAPRALARVTVLFIGTLIDALIALMRHGVVGARRVLHPWEVVFLESGDLRKRRKVVRRTRAVPDRDVMALQVTGAAQWREALRPVTHDDNPPAYRNRTLIGVSLVAAVIVGWGTRHLLTGHLPNIGELAAWPSLGTVTHSALSGWQVTGLGVAAPAPTLFGLLTLAGIVFLGHMTLLQHVLVLGMLPLGALGAARLARPLASKRAEAVVVVAYLVVPLPYNALAGGRWSGLVAYAACPWALAILARVMGLAPFDAPVAVAPDPRAWPPPRPPRPRLDPGRRVVALALVTALAAAVAPGFLIVVVVMAALLALGGLVTRAGRGPSGRVLAAGVLSALGALVLLFPWSLSWLPPTGEWATFTKAASSGPPATHLATLLRFQTGPLGAGVLGYALLLAAALPVVVGQGWRSDWAIRLWTVAVGSFVVAWGAQHGVLGITWPGPDMLLAPAAIAVALSVGMGVAAFDTDLASFTFGWRQVASGVAAVAAALACVPVAVRAVDGRWQQPTAGYDALLSWMPAKRADGDFRVLWLGSPDVLPISGWRITNEDPAYATSRNGVAGMIEDSPGTSHGTTRLLAQAVVLAERGDTTQLGHLLAPMGVRYIVEVSAASPLSAVTRPLPPAVDAGLQSQLDLGLVDTSPQATIYQNEVWAPVRLLLPPTAVGAAQLNDPRVAGNVLLNPPPVTPVLTTPKDPTTFSGTVPAGAVEVDEAPSSHWRLTVGGHAVSRQAAFADANLFTVVAGGKGSLSYRTPLGWRAAYLLGFALWVAAIGFVVRGKRRRA